MPFLAVDVLKSLLPKGQLYAFDILHVKILDQIARRLSAFAFHLVKFESIWKVINLLYKWEPVAVHRNRLPRISQSRGPRTPRSPACTRWRPEQKYHQAINFPRDNKHTISPSQAIPGHRHHRFIIRSQRNEGTMTSRILTKSGINMASAMTTEAMTMK